MLKLSNLVSKKPFNYTQLYFLDKYIQETNGIICGGCFKDIFSNKELKDIDIYFRNSIDYNKAKEKLLSNKEYIRHYETNKVLAFKEIETGIVLELIKTDVGNSAEEIISKFDFTITKFAYFVDKTEDKYKILHHKDFFEHVLTKRLVIDDKLYFPVNTWERSYKYSKYGYGLCKESKIKLLTEINKLEDINESDLLNSIYFGFD